MRKTAKGTSYIICDYPIEGSEPSRVPMKWLVFPKEGKVYDFSQTSYAWVCGFPYDTTANGSSSPVNVAGEKIRILRVTKGNPHVFSEIEFEYIVEKDIVLIGFQEEYYRTLSEAMANGTSITTIIDWGNRKVYSPNIQDNTWYSGDFKEASPNCAAEMMTKYQHTNPYAWDWKKIRRRVEDALRKTQDKSILLECALRLNVKLD